VAAKLFSAQDILKASTGKALSTPATVGSLPEQCEGKLQALSKGSSLGGQAGGDVGGQGPGRQRHDHGLDLEFLSGVSPSRVLPALKKRDAFYDEELGFLDLDEKD
jgi:hypothetical protein